MVINLGRRTGAREGLSFAFYSGADGSFKGELVLLQAGSQESTAEIIHLADPSVLPAAGDILSLEDRGQTYGAGTEKGGEESAEPGQPAGKAEEAAGAGEEAGSGAEGGGFYCYGHGEFMARLRRVSGGAKRFALALLRPDGDVKVGQGLDSFSDVLNRAAFLWNQRVGGEGAFAGYYGMNGLVFCHPGGGEELLETVTDSQENGFIYEIEAFRDAFLRGDREVETVSHQLTLACAKLLEEIRKEDIN